MTLAKIMRGEREGGWGRRAGKVGRGRVRFGPQGWAALLLGAEAAAETSLHLRGRPARPGHSASCGPDAPKPAGWAVSATWVRALQCSLLGGSVLGLLPGSGHDLGVLAWLASHSQRHTGPWAYRAPCGGRPVPLLWGAQDAEWGSRCGPAHRRPAVWSGWPVQLDMRVAWVQALGAPRLGRRPPPALNQGLAAQLWGRPHGAGVAPPRGLCWRPAGSGRLWAACPRLARCGLGPRHCAPPPPAPCVSSPQQPFPGGTIRLHVRQHRWHTRDTARSGALRV